MAERVYVAGPIAGKPNGNYLAFSTAAEWLKERGYLVINPHDVKPLDHEGDCPPGPQGGEEGDGQVRHNAPCYMRTDLAAMLTCDAIYLLDGWELSSGARTEFEAARAAGLTVMYQRGDSIDVDHLERQRAWSAQTFGPGRRTVGILQHIRKELQEIEEEPLDLGEWVDVVILALDGAWRAGYSPTDIIGAIKAKQTRNEGRTWPDWREASEDVAIEHVREVKP
ncbi:MAG: DUF550 domain-containing protein [Microthrixaceae bacterium]|nr:DUF550 domain-containing protein [Microthrixaceae bacterium]